MIDYEIKDKNKTLILCIFGGIIGLHHFYNKKVGKGILYLFTCGLFYIGWIIDIVKIIKIDNDNKKLNNNINQGIYCSNCGTINRDIDNYCSYCGILLNNSHLKRNQSLYTKTKTENFVDNYIIFDLETTGLNPKDDKIIEIGALKYQDNNLIDSFSILINPKEKLSKKIIEITGITDDMLKDCDTIDNVLPKFLNWIEDYTLIAHNGSFDLGFIENKIKELNLEMINNKNIDTLYLSRKYITNIENHRLETLKKYFNLNYDSHRALNDCYITNHVYQHCKNKKN